MTSNTPGASTKTRTLAILVMQCVVVLACVAVTTLVALAVQDRSIRVATTERVLDVSRSLADLDQVRTAVQGDTASAMAELQPLADILQEASGVDYVVITDAAGIRLTHPTPDQRGLRVSTDPSAVLDGETFVGTGWARSGRRCARRCRSPSATRSWARRRSASSRAASRAT